MWSIETFAVDECVEVTIISESVLAHFKKKNFFLEMTHVELGGWGVPPPNMSTYRHAHTD